MKAKIILPLLGILPLATVLSVVALNHRNKSGNGSVSHQRTFEVRGQIRGIDVAGKTVRIAHEKIPNDMPAMIMPFPVKNADTLKGFSAGESVQF